MNQFTIYKLRYKHVDLYFETIHMAWLHVDSNELGLTKWAGHTAYLDDLAVAVITPITVFADPNNYGWNGS